MSRRCRFVFRLLTCGWLLIQSLFPVDLPTAIAQSEKLQQPAHAPEKPESIKYVGAKAFYVLPKTHNNQSGYFSLSEGRDGNIHIGTAAYGQNAYLVEFDPAVESQRVVIDTNKVCELDAEGYAAQAKIHTRNFVGRSGVVYVGSKQGYRLDKDDQSEYPGGYVMSYDPRNGRTRNLGMPFKGQGVADVTADEKRGLSYVVTCEDQHWMIGDLEGGPYRELGPMLTPYAVTLIAADGRAYAITHDFKLASYDPDQNQVTIRPIKVDDKPWTRANNHSIPTWVLTSDKKRAFLILLNDPTLLEIDLVGSSATVNHGKMIEGKNPDSRCGLDLGADGNVYSVVRTDNETGFGKGYLHHLLRFLPEQGKMEDLGVLKVDNPDFFDWEKTDADGKPQKWTHGFHRLPDETLTPLHAHMSLKVARDNTIYLTVIYPFTLLKIDKFKIDKTAEHAEKYLDWAEQSTFRIEKDIGRFTKVAETIAERHIKGGLIGFPFFTQPIAQDLWGRSGGLMHIGFDRPWKATRTDSEKANDVAFVGYEAAPGEDDLNKIKALKQRGVFVVGFGPQNLQSLKEVCRLCDAWFDTGFEADDRVVKLPNGSARGRGNIFMNATQATTLVAETVGALTRRRKMPTIWKGYAYDDGRAWGEKYFKKTQFHADYQVSPIAAGDLGRRYLTQIRYPIRRLRRQGTELRKAARALTKEVAANRTVYVAWQGHMPLAYVGKGDDANWAKSIEFHPFLQQQVDAFDKVVPDAALVLSLGYHGLDPIQAETWNKKQNRVIHLAGNHPDNEWKPGDKLAQSIELGFAFGDACVSIDGYPLCLFAPSGIAQVLAYEAIQTEMDLDAQD